MEWLQFREPVNTWTHFVWMLLAVPGTLLLWQRGRGDRPKQLSFLVFGVGLILCFGLSSLLHGVRLRPDQHELLDLFVTFDHIGIYILIAATATGMAFTLLRGGWRWGLLGGIWGTAVVGIVGRLTPGEWPRWVDPCLYLAMGWGMAAVYPKLVEALGRRPVRLIWIGGLFYTLGALFYILQWPILWPGVIGAHELLHLADMAGSLTHFWFVIKYVAPFERLALPAEVAPSPILAAEQV
jgi:hemolysin III